MTAAGVCTLALAAVLVVACQADEDPAASSGGAGTGRPSTAPAGGCPAVEVGDVQPGAVLVPGPGNGLPRSTAEGEALVIVGAILDAGCQPADGASLRVWHTDAGGAYGQAEGECCYYQGSVRTDDRGRFRLETVKPGRYDQTNAPPAHIHLEVRHASGGLDTEIVFAGEPGVPSAPVSGFAPVALERGPAGQSWYGEVTLVVEPAG